MKISEVKQLAKVKLTENYIKCCSSSLLYFTIIAIITFLQTLVANSIANVFLLAIIQALLLIANWVLGYGIIANILDLIDVKTNAITDFINTTIKNFIKYIKIGLRVLLKILVPLLIFLVIAFYWSGTMVAKINNVDFLCFYKNLVPLVSIIWALSGIVLLYFVIKYSLVAYIYYENHDMPEKEIVDKSKALMKGNVRNYILLILSFFHWFLIGALILFILGKFIEEKFLIIFMVFFYSVLRPYIVSATFEFYKELDSSKDGSK